MVVSDLLDNLLYYRGQVFCGQQLDELRVFDRRFRLIAGRRNGYTWICFFGFWAGVPLHIFIAALSWARITLGVHSLGPIYHVCQHLAMASQACLGLLIPLRATGQGKQAVVSASA